MQIGGELLDPLGAQLRGVTGEKEGKAVARVFSRRRPDRITGEAAPIAERRHRCHVQLTLAVLVYAAAKELHHKRMAARRPYGGAFLLMFCPSD